VYTRFKWQTKVAKYLYYPRRYATYVLCCTGHIYKHACIRSVCVIYVMSYRARFSSCYGAIPTEREHEIGYDCLDVISWTSSTPSPDSDSAYLSSRKQHVMYASPRRHVLREWGERNASVHAFRTLCIFTYTYTALRTCDKSFL